MAHYPLEATSSGTLIVCCANLRVYVYVDDAYTLVILRTTKQNVEDPCFVFLRYARHTKAKERDVDAHADVEM